MISEYQTSDIGFAAYLKMKSYPLLWANRGSEDSRKFDFCFDIPKNICDTEKIAFSNSEAQKFDSAMKSIKSIIRTGNPRQ